MSTEVKQTFQVIAVLATIMVVGIHYKSDVPQTDSLDATTWNQVLQEFLFGGMARVAVPLFAFTSGVLYFRDFDASWKCYSKKTRSRIRSIVFPYFLTASVAFLFWMGVRYAEGEATALTAEQLFSTWLLSPPAEQLWFLRDLILLSILAPIVHHSMTTPVGRNATIGVLALLWLFQIQTLPIVGRWYLISSETLLFFSIGCLATRRLSLLQRLGESRTWFSIGLTCLWCSLVACRIWVRPNMDFWYASNYGVLDLTLHQLSIVVGCFAMWTLAWRLRQPRVLSVAGLAFFVYLTHEFPLRAIMHRGLDPVLPASVQCWVLIPVVLVLCVSLGKAMARHTPMFLAMVTGGRGIVSRRFQEPKPETLSAQTGTHAAGA